jgi:alpha/beta superfamily hydrolase
VSEPGSTQIALVGSVVAMTAALIVGFAAQSDVALEEPVCGRIKESLGFLMWRTLAGSVDDSAPARLNGSRADSIETADGRILRGLVLEASAERPDARGYVLVAQGNAMLADRIIRPFAAFQAAGMDVHIYDYRGYGRSTGQSRLKAIVADYRHIIRTLSLRYGEGKRYLYGLSFGGVVLLNAVGRSTERVDAFVIDSSPSHVSDFGCPAIYDPVHHVPDDASHMMLIAGGADTVVTPSQMAALTGAGRAHGARIVFEPAFQHPFHDPRGDVRRLQLILDFFRQR